MRDLTQKLDQLKAEAKAMNMDLEEFENHRRFAFLFPLGKRGYVGMRQMTKNQMKKLKRMSQ